MNSGNFKPNYRTVGFPSPTDGLCWPQSSIGKQVSLFVCNQWPEGSLQQVGIGVHGVFWTVFPHYIVKASYTDGLIPFKTASTKEHC